MNPIILIIIFITGFVTSYTDIKFGKIGNKVILPAIILALLVNLLDPQFLVLPDFIFNAISAFLFGFVLYLANLWSAGDAKLFLAYAILVPLTVYSAGYFSFFASFAIIVNTFAPIFLFSLIFLLITSDKGAIIMSLQNTFEPKKVIGFTVVLFALIWIIEMLYSYFSISGNFFLTLIIIFILIELVNLLVPGSFLIFAGLISVLRLILDWQAMLNIEFWFGLVLFVLSFLLLRFFVLRLGIMNFGKRVKIEELEEGMVLLEGVVKSEKGFEKKQLFHPTLFNVLSELKIDYAVNVSSSGLKKEDISNLLKWKKEGTAPFRTLLIQETLPFAPFMFIGVLLTVFLGTDVVIFVLSLA